jgi:hypothetical protein
MVCLFDSQMMISESGTSNDGAAVAPMSRLRYRTPAGMTAAVLAKQTQPRERCPDLLLISDFAFGRTSTGPLWTFVLAVSGQRTSHNFHSITGTARSAEPSRRALSSTGFASMASAGDLRILRVKEVNGLCVVFLTPVLISTRMVSCLHERFAVTVGELECCCS